jgi:hypothetical protein
MKWMIICGGSCTNRVYLRLNWDGTENLVASFLWVHNAFKGALRIEQNAEGETYLTLCVAINVFDPGIARVDLNLGF